MGTLAKLIGKDPADFELIRARDSGDARGWMWAVDSNQQAMMNNNGEADGAAMRAFFAFWKDHHAEYGVKESPSSAAVPQPGPPNGRFRGGFRGGPVPVPIDGPVPVLPVPAEVPGAAPAVPEAPAPNPPLPVVRPLPAIRGGAAG
jgi:hypothetical protein